MKKIMSVVVLTVFAVPALGGTEKPTADQIIAKCLASYDRLKTFQATIVVRTSQGDLQTKTEISVKAQTDGTGVREKTCIQIASGAVGPLGNKTIDQHIYDDGTVTYTVNQKDKQFSKGIHKPDKVSGLFRASLSQAAQSRGKLSVKTVTYQSRQVYELSSKTTAVAVSILIDKQTYRLLSCHGTFTNGQSKVVTDMLVS